METETRRDLLTRLSEAGVGDRIADEVATWTAPDRHRARVAHALATARAAVASGWVGPRDPAREETTARVALLLDAAGVGGRQDIEGAGTLRIPWAATLGKGRHNASDGPAWDAAEVEAGGSVRVRWDPECRRLVATHYDPTIPAPPRWIGPVILVPTAVYPARWLCAELFRALLRALDVDGPAPALQWRTCGGSDPPARQIAFTLKAIRADEAYEEYLASWESRSPHEYEAWLNGLDHDPADMPSSGNWDGFGWPA